MDSVHRFAIAGVLVVVMAAASFLTAPALPDPMVSHWNGAGQANGTMPKAIALSLLPVLTGMLVGLLALVPRIDPLRENIATFRPYYDWFIVLFAGFMLVIHTAVIAFNLGYQFDISALVVAAVAGLFYYLGILLDHAERNWFIGIRTPWTLSSDAVWARTHWLGSRLFKLSAILALVGIMFGRYAIYFLLVPALFTAIVTVVYSYYLYERIERDGDPVV